VGCVRSNGCGCEIECEMGWNPQTYLHECPFCHVIHENFAEREEWCKEHRAKRRLFNERPRDIIDWSWDWACPGCEACGDRVKPEPPAPAPPEVIVLGQN
jgi:hypothetical protein